MNIEKILNKLNIKKMKLSHQIFIIIFLTVFTLTNVALYATKYNVNEGFRKYLKQRETNKNEDFLNSVRNIYKISGNFDILTNNNGQGWFLLLNKDKPKDNNLSFDFQTADKLSDINFAENLAMLDTTLNKREQIFSSPPEIAQRKVALLDVNNDIIIGEIPFNSATITKNIVVNKKVVGKLVFQTFDSTFFDNLDDSFLKSQTQFIFIVAALVFVAALITITIVINFWVSPIKQMINGAKEISSGNYDFTVKTSIKNEIGILAESFNKMAKSIKNNEEAKKDMIADISHELRTPLTILKGEVESFIDEIREPNQENLTELLKEIDSLSNLVNEIHQLALYDVKNWSYNKEDILLKDIYTNVKNNFYQVLQEKKIKITENINVDGIIKGDKERINQLFKNLFENTLKYTNEMGNLHVSINELGSEIMVVFEDSYPGVSDEQLNKIFYRFYRVENSRNRNYGGSGLGLTLCSKIVESHNGSITAHHSDLGGVRFVIKFNKEKI